MGSCSKTVVKARILLFQIAWRGADRELADVWAPIGIAFVAAALRAAGYVVHTEILPGSRSGEDRLDDILSQEKPAAVGFGATGNEIDQLKRMGSAVKERHPDVPVIAGGYCSMKPQSVLAGNGVDVVVIGEGELTVPELVPKLLAGTDLNCVAGIAFTNKFGAIVRTPARAAVEPLDSLPLPFYTHSPAASGIVRVYASRGCPFECTFCRIKDFYATGKVRRHSATYMMRLLRKLQRDTVGKLSVVYFNDDEFLLDRYHLSEMALVVRDLGLKMCFQTRSADVVRHADYIARNKDVIHQVHLGIESFAQTQLDRWQKRTTVATNQRALEILSSMGCAYYPYILLTDAQTTWQEIDQTCSGLLTLPPCPAQPWNQHDAGAPVLSPLAAGLHLNRMKSFFGHIEAAPETNWLEGVWSYITDTVGRANQLANLNRSMNVTRRGRLPAESLLLGRIKEIASLARRLSDTRGDADMHITHATETFNHTADELVADWLTQGLSAKRNRTETHDEVVA